MNAKIIATIKKHPFISLERLQRHVGACQGPRATALVLFLASQVEAGNVAIVPSYDVLRDMDLATYEWIGVR